MQLPIHLASSGGRSLQEQLFDQFVAQLAEGLLRPGMRMPATRQLAIDLGVSRNTVVLTYERLVAEGFIEMRPPLGAFVTARGVPGIAIAPPPARDEAVAAPPVAPRAALRFRGRMHALRSAYADEVELDFWVGRPDPRLFPVHAWRKLVETSLAQMQHGDGSYGEPAGLRKLRAAVAGHVGAARGIVCSADDVIVTNGIQEGINIVARLLLVPGDAVGMECPGYAGAANVFASHGARLVPLEVDDEGAQPADLPSGCSAVYLTPAHQYPSGAALSAQRRRAWLRWAREHGGFLVEDDYDSDFYFDSAPMPALKAEDRDDSVIYLGTFSKSLAAGMRLGYLIAPRALRDAAVTIKGLLTNGSPWLLQASLAAFIDSGEFAHHLRRLRKHYAARRDALASALARHFGGAPPRGMHAGMHLVWQAPAALPDAAAIEPLARAAGVGVYSLRNGNAWLHGPPERWARALLLGYAALDEHEIASAIGRLAAALQPGRA
ncbi:MAG: PLP-dependent aminotransferase family protein [Burkholderiaceae bacterium]|nr:PLP-dependent aminotransferase family protein [Burkholderiaceae bacterium]